MNEGLGNRDWRRLIHTIQNNTCILLLGAEAATAADPEGTPLVQRLAETLAAELEQSAAVPARDDLPVVAQSFEAAEGRVELELEVADFYREFAERTTPLHEHLAAVPFSVYINTAPDPALANALQAAGRRPQIEHYDFRKARRFELTEPTPERPWVFHLYGSLADPGSLVLTDSDLLDYLAAAVSGAPRLPAALISRLKDPDTSLLFVCFGFRRWYLRLLLHVLRTHDRAYDRPKNPSLALENSAFYHHPEQPSTLFFFERTHRIHFHRASCCDFAAELAERVEPLVSQPPPPAPALPPDAPVIFLSYATEDNVRVEALSEQLQARGLGVWLDRQNLRGGDRWRMLIPDVIRTQVDYVVVLQTPNLLARVESYVYREIDEALERQKTFAPGLRFVIPALLEPVTRIDSLSELHWVDLTTAEGVDNLIATIEEDWQRRHERGRQSA